MPQSQNPNGGDGIFNAGDIKVTIGDATTVPEPLTLALLCTGLTGLAAARRHRRV